jgi:hypothetical protein
MPVVPFDDVILHEKITGIKVWHILRHPKEDLRFVTCMTKQIGRKVKVLIGMLNNFENILKEEKAVLSII